MSKPTEPRDIREIRQWDLDADVVVVGLGCAGAAATLEAARAGARVVVLERASGGGGTSAMSGGVIYLGGGTAVQRACGFEDSPEAMFAYLMASSGPRPDEAKIRAYSDGSVEHFDWLVAQGVPFKATFYPHYSGEPPTDDGLVYSGSENAHPYNELATPAPRGHVPQIPGRAGGLLMQTLLAAVGRSGAEVVTDARVQTLVFAPDGASGQSPARRVVGAIARIDGAERAVRARRGVILTTGGFINNDTMLRQHAPLLMRCQFRVGADGDDGSGIRMGIGAGGAAVNLGMGSVSLPLIPPKKLQKGILVDGYGQRFINEDAYYGRLGEYALFRHDGRAFLVLDNETFERPEVPREIAAVGETVAEIERELGLPDGTLQTTVALYNRHAERGEDPVFRKAAEWVAPLVHPPYAALDCTVDSSLYAAFTLGGLHTTPEGEVLTADGDVIPGLFAAGRASAGIAAPGYSSGISIGDGTFFGRRAGRRAGQS
jgi:succinate dehydrogenase/fumarate reductase flavoprotein subunit